MVMRTVTPVEGDKEGHLGRRYIKFEPCVSRSFGIILNCRILRGALPTLTLYCINVSVVSKCWHWHKSQNVVLVKKVVLVQS